MRQCSTFTRACAVQGLRGNPLRTSRRPTTSWCSAEHRGLYSGVEFTGPEKLRDILKEVSKAVRTLRRDSVGPVTPLTCKINTKKGSSESSGRPFEYAKKYRYPRSRSLHKANVVRGQPRVCPETAKEVAKDYLGVRDGRRQRRRDLHVAAQGPREVRRSRRDQPVRDIISDLCAQMVGGLGFGCSGNIGEKLAVF